MLDMDGNDVLPLIKIEPEEEILVSTEVLVTIKNEIAITAQCPKSLDTEEVQQTDCGWDIKTQIANRCECDFGPHTTNSFNCAHCDYGSENKQLFQLHILTHQCNVLQCAHCDYATNNNNYFKRHLLTHNKSKNLKCDICHYETNNSYCFKQHLLNHTDSKDFKCANCHYKTNDKYCFKRHLLTHTDSKYFLQLGMMIRQQPCGWDGTGSNIP
ncbi:zinc finger protein 710-like [Photinus pyralis]|uniref:zinc finger protein 710-like n=1 Tax=Photinus pyralis TaxID=7054 RepID=UPI0012675782|nr:zinc finger protein 710-like [Photinus pyralis]